MNHYVTQFVPRVHARTDSGTLVCPQRRKDILLAFADHTACASHEAYQRTEYRRAEVADHLVPALVWVQDQLLSCIRSSVAVIVHEGRTLVT